jgi:hypothetical protein
MSPKSQFSPGDVHDGARLGRRIGVANGKELWEGAQIATGRRVVVFAQPNPSEPERPIIGVHPLQFTLGDLLAGEGPAVADLALAAAVALALEKAGPPIVADSPLQERTLLLDDGWFVWGSANALECRGLLESLDPEDELGIAGLFAEDAPAGRKAGIVRALADLLARERHALVRRSAAADSSGQLARLRTLTARLWRCLPPPAGSTHGVVCDGRSIRLPDQTPAWDGVDLRPSLARAALRSMASAPESPIRRWLSAMSRLRVDREILHRRG